MILDFNFQERMIFRRSLICVSFHEMKRDFYLKGQMKGQGFLFFSLKHSVDLNWCFCLSGCFTYFHNEYKSDHTVGLDDGCRSFPTEQIY